VPVLLASALLAVLSALAFPVAPVTQPTVDVAWPPPGAPAVTALPLMPYQPVTLRASTSCEAIRATPPGAAVLATVGPWVPDGDTGGLRMRAAGAGLAVSSNGIALATVPLPPGPCTVTVDTTAERTVVALDGAPVATTDADVRPVVSALWTAAPSTAGLAVALRTDTRFQTTPSALKWALGAGVVLGVAGVAACAVVADRAAHPRRARRRAVQLPLVHPGPVDAVVVVGLAVWAVIGPATVDDGYIAGIVRGRGENGFVGNVYRWLNAPEAPFSWFYDLDRAWAALAPGPGASVLWLRVPATVLGVLIWAVLRRHVLPRLGPALNPPSARWTAALVFAAWWLPFGLSLRPEPWVALGVLAVWASTERAVATGRSTPLVVAAGLGGLTVALTPGALGGLVPLVVALPALARRTRSRTTPGTVGAPTLPVTARLAAVVAGGTLAVLAMAGDQGLDGLREAARVRTVIGGQVARFAAAHARSGAPIRDYALTTRPEQVDLGGVSVPTWTYGTGTVPGPLLLGTTGDQLRVALTNQLPTVSSDGAPTGTSVHWHGLAIRNDMDGVPDVTQPAIAAGTTATYQFTLPHPGTYWYHSHDGVQRDRGLTGPLIIDDPAEPGRYDTEFIVMLDDWIDGIGGATPAVVLADLHRTGMRMRMDMSSMGSMMGGSTSAVGGDGGDVDYPYYLVNGRIPASPTVFTARPGQRARLRVINAAADTAFRVALGGHRLTVTHTDAYPVAPTPVDTVLLGSGERYDLLVDLGDGVFPLAAAAEGKTGGARALVRTSGCAAAPPAGLVPAELAGRMLGYGDLHADPSVVLPARAPDRTHQLVLTADMGRYVWMINGRTFDQHQPLPVRAGERVRLEFVNQTMMYHPMHLHGHTFALRDPLVGGRADGARKDTVNVLPNQTVAAEFEADNPGQWLTHCHLAYHEAAGMMTVVSYQT